MTFGPVLFKVKADDPPEQISRELEYQIKRGKHPLEIRISPEVHTRMRALAGVRSGSQLLSHDDVPVVIDPKMIGPRAWRVVCRELDTLPEKQVDARKAWDPSFTYGPAK